MWERMYEEFWDKLEHFCYKLCRDEDRAEDLTQEVFLKALQNRTPHRTVYAGPVQGVAVRSGTQPLLRPGPPRSKRKGTAGTALPGGGRTS